MRGKRRRRELDASACTYAYELVASDGEDRIAVALNTGDGERRIALPGAREVLLSTGEPVRLAGDTVVLPARTGCVVTVASR